MVVFLCYIQVLCYVQVVSMVCVCVWGGRCEAGARQGEERERDLESGRVFIHLTQR